MFIGDGTILTSGKFFYGFSILDLMPRLFKLLGNGILEKTS
jgi:hypothetical protein